MLPIGSVEQHGPMGLIGTDVICASEVAARAADLVGAAFGTLITSVILIPYLGITGAASGLIAIKIISLILVSVGHDKN